jgi:poly(A) polymerase
MAINVVSGTSGKLIDLFDGQRDILDRKLRICSETSIQDDPIRILRGVRLGVNLGFSLDETSKSSMCESVHLLDAVSAERKRDELFKLFTLDKSPVGLSQLVLLGAFPILFHECSPENLVTEAATSALFIKVKSGDWGGISIDPAYIREYLQNTLVEERSIIALLKIASLFMRSKNYRDAVDRFAIGYALSNRESAYLNQAIKGQQQLIEMCSVKKSFDDIGIYHFYQHTENAGIGSCLLALVETSLNGSPETIVHMQNTVIILLEAYFHKAETYINIQLLLDGNDLIKKFKMKPGPRFKVVLESLKEAQVSGKVTSRLAAERFIQGLLDKE